MSDEPRAADRQRVHDSLDYLRPFVRHRATLDTPEQVAATLAAILCLLDGQPLDTAHTILDGAKGCYASVLAKRAAEGAPS